MNKNMLRLNIASQNINHKIVYEFEDMMLIAKNEDLTGVFSVSRRQITY